MSKNVYLESTQLQNPQTLATRATIAALCVLVSLGSLPVFAGAFTMKPVVQPADFSGESLFRGLFFGEGKVAEMFPEIWDGHSFATSAAEKEGQEAAVALREGLVDTINKIDATFFERFGEAMSSGNHVLIASSLDEASGMLMDSLSKELGQDVQSLADLPDEGVGRAVAVAVTVAHVVATVSTIAVAVAGAIAVTAVIVANSYIFWSTNGQQTNSPLQREYYVDLIAERLS